MTKKEKKEFELYKTAFRNLIVLNNTLRLAFDNITKHPIDMQAEINNHPDNYKVSEKKEATVQDIMIVQGILNTTPSYIPGSYSIEDVKDIFGLDVKM